jgi:hypothetical protein
MSAPRPPVIIIGMSRSGTSMLTRMLDDLGLFVGSRVTGNHEAIFFRDLNDWLLTQCSGGLENPGTIKYLLGDDETRALYGDFIKFSMKTPRAVSFLGLGKYLRYRTPADLDIPWGWKDPRNTFTLSFWLDIFPEARVIHIYRHPLDIINSLRTRRKRGLARLRDRHAGPLLKPLYLLYLVRKFIGGRRVFVDLRGASLEEGFILWEEYMKEAREHVAELGERAVEVKYEYFLDNPSDVLKSLVEFCGLGAGIGDIEKAAAEVNKSRGYAFLNDPELKSYSLDIAARLEGYGY